ncbi:MAG: aminotransferase class IV [Bacteroidales bacterium]|nr:aminotransferase class IV [Bacteroidales bacterium]MBN2761841.1 aminotransferase class IV [Bacteroidales bacterium]
MKDFTGRYCIINNQTETTDSLNKNFPTSSVIFYEVIRVIDGVLLFLEDHLKRLDNSVKKYKNDYTIDYEYLKEVLLKLLIKNDLHIGNIKLLVFFDPDGKEPLKTIAHQVLHSYPSDKLYHKGIRTSLYFVERKNPNIKAFNIPLQEKCRTTITDQKLYEVLLVDHNGYVTEGSKSNVFFIQKGSLLTPPFDRVLKGITREKVMDICKSTQCDLKEENIAVKRLSSFDAAFITGTSSKILPVASINDITYEANHPLTGHIKTHYDRMIEDYIMKVRQKGYQTAL